MVLNIPAIMMMYVYVSVYVLLPDVWEFGIFACWYAMIIFVNLTKLSGLIWDWFASYDCRASKWSRQNCERNVRSNSILFLRIKFSHKKTRVRSQFYVFGCDKQSLLVLNECHPGRYNQLLNAHSQKSNIKTVANHLIALDL